MKNFMRKISGIMVAFCCVFMLGVNVMTVWGANWYDRDWEFTASPTGTMYTDKLIKEDSSKVYVKNYSDSPAAVSVTIHGGNKNDGESICTFNTSATYRQTPYSIPAGTYKYCSSTVFETYDTDDANVPAYAYLEITGYYSGTYHGLWSPDNLNGY